MQNYYDILTQIYKQANPAASEEDIKAQVDKTDPKAAQNALASYLPSNYDVAVSDTTVPMEGRPGSLASTNVPPTPNIPEIPDTSPVIPPVRS